MRLFITLLSILILILTGEASPRRYHESKIFTKNTKAAVQRLSDNVKPDLYRLDLTLLETFYETQTFTGVATIHLTITNATKSFEINAKDLDMSAEGSVTLKLDSGNANQEISVTETDTENGILTISNSKEENFASGGYTLIIKYTGKLSESSMQGFYLSSYKEGDVTKYLATTQFEEMGARRAFPCFDDPALKARFDITITHPENYIANSNAAVSTVTGAGTGYKKTTFKQSPLMSTYLVAFIVSELECTTGTNIAEEIPNTVCARPGLKDTIDTAAETAVKVLEKMIDYTGVTYKDMGINKLDQFAIPDFAAGAMENWGLVTYREADLLFDKAESSEAYKKAVTSVVAHELSHQWFGDLVTLDWWSDIFLNEGFATFFEYYIVDSLDTTHSEWEMTKQFVIDQLQPALVTDSGSAYPLHYSESDDPAVIEGRFDDISYNKGGSILRMIQSLLGLEKFQKGLKNYVDQKKNLNSKPEDLWTALGAQATEALPKGVDFTTVMENWTSKSGYPLLTVTLDKNNIAQISQEQFLLSGTGDTKWYVPVTYTLSDGTSSPKAEWLTPEKPLSINITNASIVLNNEQTGYYRVKYDDTLSKKISDALATKIDSIDEINRAQIVDDQLNLARAGKAEYSDVLKFLKFLKTDDSYYSWSAAFNSFNYLLQRTSDSAVRKSLMSYLSETMEALLKSVPIAKEPTKHIDILKYVLANTWSCKLGNEECITEATKEFSEEKVSANKRSIVYCYGLQNQENQKEGFDALWKKYTETQLATEQVTILKALGCTTDKALQKSYLEKTLTDDIRRQDARYAFSSVYSSGPDGVTTVLNFVKDSHDNFTARFGDSSYTLSSVVSGAADMITTADQLTLLMTLKDTVSIVDDLLTTVRANLKTTETLEKTFKEYFGISNNNSAFSNTSSFINLGFVVIAYLMFNLY